MELHHLNGLYNANGNMLINGLTLYYNVLVRNGSVSADLKASRLPSCLFAAGGTAICIGC